MAKQTLESNAYADGVYAHLLEEGKRYKALLKDAMTIQAKLDFSEKSLCAMRDHLRLMMQKPDVAVKEEWKAVLSGTRFIGRRLADACVELLQTHQKMTFEELLDGLNIGNYRFRTDSPLREIHAALLRHPHIKREGDVWKWTGPARGERQKRLRLLKAALNAETKT